MTEDPDGRFVWSEGHVEQTDNTIAAESTIDSETEDIWETGPGRGWWGPPIGTHGAGKQDGGISIKGGGKLSDETHTEIQQIAGKLPAEHTSGVSVKVTDDIPGLEENWNGAYLDGVIMMKPDAGSQTFVHELGHHVDQNLWPSVRTLEPSSVPQYSREFASLGTHGWKYGMNTNEMGNSSEYIAGFYRGWANTKVSGKGKAISQARTEIPMLAGIMDGLFEGFGEAGPGRGSETEDNA